MALLQPALRPRPVRSSDRSRRAAPAETEAETEAEAEAEAATSIAIPMRLAPLLAVCGLCGGAGASTLSYLLARFAVRSFDGHVLVCDTGGPTGGLAARARVETPRSLSESAEQLARGLPLTGGLYTVDGPGSDQGRELRVIATGPRFTRAGDPDGLQALLEMARSGGAHALTVVDCGTLQRTPDRLALRAASHIAWVLPATHNGACRAQRVLAAVPPDAAGRELVVARRERDQPTAALKALKALAEQRRAPLVLMPHLSHPSKDPARALRESQVSLQAICGVLGR